MFFGLGYQNKTVKILRKNKGLTAKDLAIKLKVDTVEVLKIDEMKIKDIPEPIKSMILPIIKK